ncbi:MAG: hypothetical protein WC631_02435 [Candidatus Paceibacterota bacterium]
MITLQSGVLDRTRLVSNFLMLVLVSGNIFFSIQYTENLKQQQVQKEDKIGTNIQVSRFLKLFVDIVLNTNEGQQISYDDRVQLENDVRQIKDAEVIAQWNSFVGSKDSKVAQKNAVALMKLLTNKLLID